MMIEDVIELLELKDIQVTEELGLSQIEIGLPWMLSGDWMVVGDVHVPTTRYGFADLLAEVAQLHLQPPRKLLIAGDMFNMDSFSNYAAVVSQPSWAEEQKAARTLLTHWLETFDEIRLILGNHERRLQKWLAGQFSEEDFRGLIYSNPKFQLSNFGWCAINSGGVPWRVTHPKNYSVNQLNVAETISWKHQANVISFHEHHLSVGWDRFKRFVIVNGGSLIDPRVPYKYLDDNKAAEFAPGFVMLKNGTPYLFGNPPFTDWGAWKIDLTSTLL